ncbi:AraC family transcriptional regulator [Phaeobacter sp. NW0010-22]|uniref:AraC family transcriptional regulator n=1 Tax=Phaeobacter sp. NW0010-22 TaxID=3135907 RepID=UPI00310B6B0B
MTTNYEDRLLRVLSYIHDNPAGDLSLDRLADEAAMSRFHWHRVFRAMTGETCAQTVRRMRLNRAAVWLVQTDWPLDQVALKCGYPNVGSFSRAFGEGYGQRPDPFRKAGRLRAPLLKPDQESFPMHPIEVRVEPKRSLAVLRHKGPYYEIGQSFEKFGAMCQSRGLWPQVGNVIGVYLDNPEVTPEADLTSFAGAEWRGEQIPEGMDLFEIEGGRTAVMTYKGPYAGIAAAYGTLFGQWLPASGEEPADRPCYEISLNNPRDTAPDELITELCLPLA